MLDIIVPVYNNLKYTVLFLQSLEQQTFKDFSVILIDNGSSDGTVDFIQHSQRSFKIFIIHNQENLGYVQAINQGIQQSKAPYIFLGNNDTILSYNLLYKLIHGITNFGIVTAYSNNIDLSHPSPILIEYKGTPNLHDVNTFSDILESKFGDTIANIEFAFGHCMLINRKVIDLIGGLDPRFGIGNYDDIDFCKRALQGGFKIGLIKGSFIYHFCHATFSSMGIDIEQLLKQNLVIFQQKWK